MRTRINPLQERWPLAAVGAWLLLLNATTFAAEGPLTAELGEPVAYRCSDGRQLVVRYGRLSDGSLAFVRLRPPGAGQLTLPRLVSGSGVRYSDEQEWQWWSKGKEGFLQRRDARGEWRTLLQRCVTGGDSDR
jgi:membrane-bound inhibitor of C-type lysozyme